MRKSTPVFVSTQDINSNKYNLAVCKCPLPFLPDGSWVHVLPEKGVEYVCTECGTVISIGKGDQNEKIHMDL